MLTVDLTHVKPKPDSRYVLRLRDRLSKESRNLNVRAGTSFEVPADAHPGPANQTVAWVDEVSAAGEVKALSPRVRSDALKHVVKVEAWLREPLATATRPEAAAMLETLGTWEFFGDSEWRSRVMRIVNDVLRRLQRAKRIPAQSRLALLCDLHAERATYTDSVPGNIMASLTGMTELHAVLAAHHAGTKKTVVHVGRPDSESVPAALRADLRSLLHSSAAFGAPNTASRLLRGQLFSILEGRDAANTEFAAALESGRETIKSLYLDMGSITYGSASGGAAAEDVSVTWHDSEIHGGAQATILYSANISFLRRYLTRILFYAAAEPDLHLHFHLVASPKEAADFVEEATLLAKTIHGFSGRQASAPNISWSSSELPAGVGNPITYFACARYLVAGQVMDRFGTDVWVQDVDLYPTAPIAQAHKALGAFDVVLAASTGINMLAPWRRYIANSVFLSRSVHGRAFAAEAASYIAAFIGEPDSWMLDQNALDWAVEAAPTGARIGNMRALNLKLTQSAMNGAIEA